MYFVCLQCSLYQPITEMEQGEWCYERRGDLLNRVFSFGSVDPGDILSSCVALCFLPRRIRIAGLNKEPPFYWATMDHPENKPLA